jgi:hypothetical protein
MAIDQKHKLVVPLDFTSLAVLLYGASARQKTFQKMRYSKTRESFTPQDRYGAAKSTSGRNEESLPVIPCRTLTGLQPNKGVSRASERSFALAPYSLPGRSHGEKRLAQIGKAGPNREGEFIIN